MGVFVSYSSRDRDAVTRLTQDLQDAEEQVWLDQRLAGGDAWWRAILEQIRGCDVFVFALSQNSIQSKPCQAELRYAQDLGLPILPVQVGHVDSLQLNPLATVQTVDYRTSTATVGMRLLSALNRARAQRQPLPSPPPDEPPVPFEYLIRLYTTISGTDYISPPDQAALVAQLQFGLREDGDHDAARRDIVTLLMKLRDRPDVTYRTRTDVDAILASIDAEAQLVPAPERPGPTATDTPPISLGSTTTLGARPTGPEDFETADTKGPRVDTPPPTTTAAEKMAVPQKSQRQTETTRVPREPPSRSVWRSTVVIVGMAVTAAILVAGTFANRLPFISFVVAAALIIAIVVLLVRRKAASAPQHLPPEK